MRPISRTIFREIFVTAMLGAAVRSCLPPASRQTLRISGPHVRPAENGRATCSPWWSRRRFPSPSLLACSSAPSSPSAACPPMAKSPRCAPRVSRAGAWSRPFCLRFFGHVLRRRRVSLAHALVHPRRAIRCSTISIASELTADVQPRVFEEQFPNKVLYVGDVIVRPSFARWRRFSSPT